MYHEPTKLAFFDFFLHDELEPLIQKGEIVPQKKEIVPGGLNGVIPGLQKLKKGVSGEKLVIELP